MKNKESEDLPKTLTELYLRLKKLSGKLPAEKSINLFHCLNELDDRSLVEEIQQSLSSGRLSTYQLSPAQWSALVFILLSSDLDEFDLEKYSRSEKAFLKLLPVVKASKKVLLSRCALSKRSFEALSEILSSPSNHLRELDLSSNYLQDSELDLLCVGLKSPDCKLETLRLRDCKLSKRSFEALSEILSSPSNHLRDLDLSSNKLQDSELDLLCVGLKSPDCKLETLGLMDCGLSEISCDYLAAALKSNPSHLRELVLSNYWFSTRNNLQDSGVKHLCGFLESPGCKLETLRLMDCGLSEISCDYLAAALKSNPSHLRKLDLRYNYKLQDPDVKQLSDLQQSPDYRLKTLLW
ncbi:ribonuclease inhibitor-like [Simochromis diagramma]|uniref:ribonuclease inhibitor-like n=1 Tax=Simochromis diagramma TaxID=43689 RepID=UPI001A7F101E|nr:ribonuclease inhibitor-like [Simochromis diagramma]